jgi:hypothetical protein
MKRSLPSLARLLVVGCFAVGVAGPRLVQAAPAPLTPEANVAVSTNSTSASSSVSVTSPERGLAAAHAITEITGVAISPMLGVGAVGAWDWYRAPDEKRGSLHWYARPWFWIPALTIVLLVGIKDIVGTAMPVVLKRPFDLVEAVENKISGLVAVGAFVPLVATIFTAVNSGEGDGAAAQTTLAAGFLPSFFASGELAWLGNVLTVPIAMAAFVLVWLVSHTVNVLILLSPWGVVDAALKAFRLAVLGVLTSAAFINPYVGAALSVVIILVCWVLAGWSFRLLVFGWMTGWDLIARKHRRFAPRVEGNEVFLARRLDDAPIRSYGHLSPPDARGHRVFEYRPWLVLPKRTLVLPEGDYLVGRGFLYPEVFTVDPESRQTRTALLLPPRYRGHEEAMAKLCAFKGVRDIGLLRGMRGAWRWLKELFGWATTGPQPVGETG